MLHANAHANQPELLTPTHGQSLVGDVVEFVWTDNGVSVEKWALRVGSAPGGKDIYNSIISGTSVTVNNLPTDGSTVYAKLFSKIANTWQLVDSYQFLAESDTAPEFVSPVDGTLLEDSTVTVEWTANGASINTWSLWAGTSPGGRDLYNSVETGTSTNITNLPMDGSTIYLRLFAYRLGQWDVVAQQAYTTASNVVPELLSPAHEKTLDGPEVTFSWTDNGALINNWSLWVGTTPGGRDILNRVVNDNTYTVTGLPTDGSQLYARLYAFKQGQWMLVEKIELQSFNENQPELLSPVNGSTLTEDSALFEWTHNNHSVNKWSLWMGTTPGGRDLFNQVVDGTNALVSDLPINGDTLYVRLYGFAQGKWTLHDAHEYLAVSIEPEPPVNLDEYDLVFGDEFSGTELDTDKWATSYLWGPYISINAEEQHYIDIANSIATPSWSPFDLNNGILTISAIPTDSVNTAPSQPAQTSSYWQDNPEYHYNPDYNASDANYLSGVIASYKSFSFTHGYVESRIKVPAGKGLWSAFWLHTFKFVEDVPEIDIMEHIGEPANTVHQTMHYFDIDDNWRLVSTPTNSVSDTDYSQNFHTYSVSWEPKKVDFFVDGVQVLSVPDTNFTIAKQAMHVIANLAVGGTWPGSPNSSTEFPAELAIDYIRVYQKKSLGTLTPAILNAQYELMFSDEFNGSELDADKWNTSYIWGPFFRINNEEQYYPDVLGRDNQIQNTPVLVSNGTLKLNAEPVSPSDLPVQPPLNDPYWVDNSHQHYPGYAQADGWIPNYTSGLITSYDSFKFVHGYAEARMKIPEGEGLWPAFWLLNGYYVGTAPEIDVMEARGGSTHEVHQSYHYFGTNGQLISQTNATAQLPQGAKYSDDFHRFGVEWRPEEIKWYVDGNVVHTVTGPEVSLQLAYVIANLAVGGNYVQDVAPESVPASLEIDYIKVWQRK